MKYYVCLIEDSIHGNLHLDVKSDDFDEAMEAFVAFSQRVSEDADPWRLALLYEDGKLIAAGKGHLAFDSDPKDKVMCLLHGKPEMETILRGLPEKSRFAAKYFRISPIGSCLLNRFEFVKR